MLHNPTVRLILGCVAGVSIAAVDEFAFRGEVSPIVIVALLLATTATTGAVWGRDGLLPCVAIWFWLPFAHAAKHALGVPDTIHPNTYFSILMLAIFSLGVSCIGFLVGLLFNKMTAGEPT